MTAQDFRQVGIMVLGASGAVLVGGLILPGDVGRALLYGATLAFVAAAALLVLGGVVLRR
jgi:hypothetical protein